MDRSNESNREDPKRELGRRSNQILAAIDDLHDLESRKRRQPISTPRFHELADEVEERSRAVFRMAGEEEELGEVIETDGDSIEDVASR